MGVDGRPIALSFTLRNMEGDILSSYHGTYRYYAASTMKLAVALTVLHTVDDGRLALDDAIPATHRYPSAAGGSFRFDEEDSDPLFPAEGDSISVRELLESMIERSCNESTNMLMGMVGIEAIHEMCARCGLHDMHVDRLIGDVAAARATGISNEVTSDDLSWLMVQAVRGDYLAAASTKLLRNALRQQRYPVIADVLPELGKQNVDWGSKSGWVDGIRHDVAFLGDPDDPHSLVLCVLSSGIEDEAAIAAEHAIAAGLLEPLLRS